MYQKTTLRYLYSYLYLLKKKWRKGRTKETSNSSACKCTLICWYFFFFKIQNSKFLAVTRQWMKARGQSVQVGFINRSKSTGGLRLNPPSFKPLATLSPPSIFPPFVLKPLHFIIRATWIKVRHGEETKSSRSQSKLQLREDIAPFRHFKQKCGTCNND